MGSAASNGVGSDRRRSRFRSGNGSARSAARKPASSLLWGYLLGEAGGLARRAVGRRARLASRGDLPRAALAGAGAALTARALGSLLADEASSGDNPGLGLELVQGAAEGLGARRPQPPPPRRPPVAGRAERRGAVRRGAPGRAPARSSAPSRPRRSGPSPPWRRRAAGIRDCSNTRRSRPRSSCSTGGGRAEPVSSPWAARPPALHAPPGVREPSIRGPEAPVASGALAGRPCRCAHANTAKQAASRASGSRPQFRQIAHRDGGEPVGDHPRQNRVQRAAARQQHLAHATGEHPAAIGIGDGGGGKGRKRRDQVRPVSPCSRLPAFHEPPDERGAEDLAAGGLGRRGGAGTGAPSSDPAARHPLRQPRRVHRRRRRSGGHPWRVPRRCR